MHTQETRFTRMKNPAIINTRKKKIRISDDIKNVRNDVMTHPMIHDLTIEGDISDRLDLSCLNMLPLKKLKIVHKGNNTADIASLGVCRIPELILESSKQGGLVLPENLEVSHLRTDLESISPVMSTWTGLEKLCIRSNEEKLFSKPTSLDISFFDGMHGIRELRVRRFGNITNISLPRLPNLELLVIEYTPLSKIDLSPLDGLQHLREVNLESNVINEIDLSPLKRCPNVKLVKLADNPFSNIMFHYGGYSEQRHHIGCTVDELHFKIEYKTDEKKDVW